MSAAAEARIQKLELTMAKVLARLDYLESRDENQGRRPLKIPAKPGANGLRETVRR